MVSKWYQTRQYRFGAKAKKMHQWCKNIPKILFAIPF
jgi:hypothetical protein